MRKKEHLYTIECQTLIKPRSAEKTLSSYKKCEKKSSTLWALVKAQHLEGTLAACHSFQRLKHFLDDIESEIKKFSSALSQQSHGEQTMEVIKNNYISVAYSIYAHNPLTQLLGDIVCRTDKLLLILISLHHLGSVFDARTMLNVKGKVIKRLHRILNEMHRISIRHMQSTTVQNYFINPSQYPEHSLSTVKKLLSVGLVRDIKVAV